MPKKKTKIMTIKEITDAFYFGASPSKLKRMVQKLIEQEDGRMALKTIKER